MSRFIKNFEKKEIKRMRDHLGMRKIKSGELTCPRCSEKFMSPDVTLQRMCDKCTLKQEIVF